MWRESRIDCAESVSESERARVRKDAIPAHLEEGVQVIGQLGVTAYVSTPLGKAPQTARSVDPQAVSVPDTTPAATLRFAWKSDAMLGRKGLEPPRARQ